MAKIAFLGNFSVPYCSESQYRVELQKLGHEVIALQETQATTEQTLKAASESDMFFWVHSHNAPNPGNLTMLQVLENLRVRKIPSVAYHLDLYYGLDRWKEYENSDYFKVDYFFTVDRKMAEWFNTNTNTLGVYLTGGAFTDQCYMADYDPLYASDIAFIGSKGYHPEWQWRPQLIDFLRITYGARFTHWGGDGKELVREEKFNKVCASTKVIVGDSLSLNFNYPYYWSERVYNVTGAGGFILHPYIEGLEEEFDLDDPLLDPGELATFKFGDFDNLKRQIDFYLENEKRRSHVRHNGMERTWRDHTYLKRMGTILETVGVK